MTNAMRHGARDAIGHFANTLYLYAAFINSRMLYCMEKTENNRGQKLLLARGKKVDF